MIRSGDGTHGRIVEQAASASGRRHVGRRMPTAASPSEPATTPSDYLRTAVPRPVLRPGQPRGIMDR